MMLINPYLSRPEINWDVVSAHSYTKTEGAGRAMLLNAPVSTGVSNEVWSLAVEQHSYTGSSSIRFNLTDNNNIASNPFINGISHIIRAKCYDSSDNFLGYVGFAYTFFETGASMFGVYVIRDVGGYSYSEQSTALNVPLFNASDVFELFVNTATREWEVTNGVYKVDGDDLLGLVPVTTSYVKYEAEFFIGYSVTGTAEINVLSVT
jgi:hypothetical protein